MVILSKIFRKVKFW